MRFKTLCIFFYLVLPALTGMAQGSNRILELESTRFAAMILRDSSALESSIDDALVYIHSNGLVQDKKEFLRSIQVGTLKYESIEPKERNVRLYKKTAIINGIVHVKGIVNGAPFEIDIRYTDVMINNKGWKLASWQSLKIN